VLILSEDHSAEVGRPMHPLCSLHREGRRRAAFAPGATCSVALLLAQAATPAPTGPPPAAGKPFGQNA